jgi:hypothetical protein
VIRSTVTGESFTGRCATRSRSARRQVVFVGRSARSGGRAHRRGRGLRAPGHMEALPGPGSRCWPRARRCWPASAVPKWSSTASRGCWSIRTTRPRSPMRSSRC